MALLICQDVSLGYQGKRVLENITFSVNTTDYLCIVGENGSGKSTLVKALVRLLTPMAGSITLDEGTQQRHIGYLPQQAEIQRDFPASVQEVVQAGCLSRCGLRPYFNPYEKFVVQSNLQRLDIRTLAKKCYRELSGGQQQRVLLARALCAVTKLLLLDEPVAGLDPISAANTYRFLEEIHDRDKTAIVMISHDVATAVNYATHVLHLGEGTMLFFGTKSEYLKSKYGRLFIPQEGGIVR